MILWQPTHRTRALAMAGALMLSVALGVVMWLTWPRTTHIDVDRGRYPVKGIDVSAYNGKVDWAKVAEDTVTFAYLRCSMGGDGRDKEWQHNYDGATAAGLRLGAYHYFRHDEDGVSQARNMIAALGGRHLELPIAVDIEDPDGTPRQDPAPIVRELQIMIDLLRQKGYRIVLYTNKKGYRRYVEGYFDQEDYDLWLSSFTPNGGGVSRRPALWQHSHVGSVKGIDGEVDLDVFNGDVHDFVRWTR